MITLVSEYKNYLQKLPELIANSDYKSQYFIKLLGVKTPTYYRKLRENSFSVNEIEKLTRALYPKEAYKQELLNDIEQGREDIKNGNVFSSEEVRKAMRDKILSYQ